MSDVAQDVRDELLRLGLKKEQFAGALELIEDADTAHRDRRAELEHHVHELASWIRVGLLILYPCEHSNDCWSPCVWEAWDSLNKPAGRFCERHRPNGNGQSLPHADWIAKVFAALVAAKPEMALSGREGEP